jgi:5'-nucleotidase
MSVLIKDNGCMVLILTNDDGVDAPGLQALLEAIQQLGRDAIIVAPRDHQSGCGHQVTTTQPIQVQKRSERVYAIAGTPADCVRIAISHLCPQVTGVLSGINSGGNLGADVYISGTVAAAREAALHRIPSIAMSHYRQGKRAIDWSLATRLTANVLQNLADRPAPPGSYWNVNLPHLLPDAMDCEIVFCPLCTQPLPAVYKVEGDRCYYAGDYAQRSRDPGSDVDVCFSRKISVTQLRVQN